MRRGAAELGTESRRSWSSTIASRAGGDARGASTSSSWPASARSRGRPVEERHVEDAARKRPLVYDKGGDAHYDFTSAFIKSIRGSDPDAALYYLAAMLEGGEDPRFIARRMIVHASEDIGKADPRALLVAVAAAHALEHVGLPEARLNLAQAAIYLARAPKSNAVIKAIGAAQADVREHGRIRPPKASATRTTPARRSSVTARATSTRRRPARLRGRLPSGRAEGDDVLQAVRKRRRARRRSLRGFARRARSHQLDGEPRRARSRGRGSG